MVQTIAYFICWILSNCNCNQLIHLRFSGTAPPALLLHQSPRPCWILWTEKTPSLSSTFEETKKVVVCNHNATRVASLTNLILNYFVCQIQFIRVFDNFFTAWLTILCWCGDDNQKSSLFTMLSKSIATIIWNRVINVIKT